jgi:hypothetical protein
MVAFEPFHGQVGWIPRLVGGEKADPVIESTFPGSPTLCLPAGRQGREASLQNVLGRRVPYKPRPLGWGEWAQYKRKYLPGKRRPLRRGASLLPSLGSWRAAFLKWNLLSLIFFRPIGAQKKRRKRSTKKVGRYQKSTSFHITMR